MFDFSQSDTAPEPSVPKKSLTYVLQVVDASSSMYHGLDITKSTYNELNQVIAKAAKEENSEIKVSLIKFSDDVKTVYENVDASELSPLTNDNYVPEGMTALYDAIGKAIQMARKFPQDEDTAFLLQILTDGGENCSKEFKANILKSMIEEVNATNKWTITIAGPQGSIDLFAQSMSIYAGNVTSFNPGSLESRVENKDMMLRGIQGYFGPQGPRGSSGVAGQSFNSTRSFYSSVAQTTSPTGEPTVDNKTSSQ